VIEDPERDRNNTPGSAGNPKEGGPPVVRDAAAKAKYKRERKLEQFQVPEIYKFDFEAPENAKKPWNDRNEADKYFNHGFNEETWRYHTRDVLARAALTEQLAANSDLQNL